MRRKKSWDLEDAPDFINHRPSVMGIKQCARCNLGPLANSRQKGRHMRRCLNVIICGGNAENLVRVYRRSHGTKKGHLKKIKVMYLHKSGHLTS